MISKTIDIIYKNAAFYFACTLLVVALAMVNALHLFGNSGKVGLTLGFILLVTRLPFTILLNAPLAPGVGDARFSRQFIVALKMGLIAALFSTATVYLVIKFMGRLPMSQAQSADQLLLLLSLVLVFPAIVTMLGSWIPSGIVGQAPGFLSAIGRGAMSAHRVFWRLAVASGAYLLVCALGMVLYVFWSGAPPVTVDITGSISPSGIAFWLLATFTTFVFLTYTTVVVCLDYLRFEGVEMPAPLASF